MVSLGGFRVVSSLDLNQLTCAQLKNEVNQLGIVLYPSEMINEKFLIKMRECVLNLPEENPLKRRLKAMARVKTRNKAEQETVTFLSEVLNSRFNLISDAEVRAKIVNLLLDLPAKTMSERLLKSFLYLIIGNVTRSDNLLKEFINTPPYINWQGYTPAVSLYHQIASENIEQIILKLSNHPADRRIYHLFTQYLLNYYKNDSLLELISDNQGPSLQGQLDLKFIEKFAPELIHHLRLQRENDTGRMLKLMDLKEISLREQALWHWPFLSIDPVISPDLVEELRKIEKDEQLWFLYLMDNEKLVDIYVKKTGKALLVGRRQYLHTLLTDPKTFMLALFKLIELGDIDQELVNKTIDFIDQ